MTDEELYAYAKAHKKEFFDRLVAGYKRSPDRPVAFFMTGLPGSGKSEFATAIHHRQPGLINLDVDVYRSWLPGYTGTNAPSYQRPAVLLLNNFFDRLLKKKYSFLFDATFASPKAVENIERCLHRNYHVVIEYVYQSPAHCLSFTRQRAKVTGRIVPTQVIFNDYFQILANLSQVQTKYSAQVLFNVHKKDLIGQNQQDYFNVHTNIKDLVQQMDRLYTKEELWRELAWMP